MNIYTICSILCPCNSFLLQRYTHNKTWDFFVTFLRNTTQWDVRFNKTWDTRITTQWVRRRNKTWDTCNTAQYDVRYAQYEVIRREIRAIRRNKTWDAQYDVRYAQYYAIRREIRAIRHNKTQYDAIRREIRAIRDVRRKTQYDVIRREILALHICISIIYIDIYIICSILRPCNRSVSHGSHGHTYICAGKGGVCVRERKRGCMRVCMCVENLLHSLRDIGFLRYITVCQSCIYPYV